MHSGNLSRKGLLLTNSVIQSYLTLCDPVDCNQPGSAAHGILQARILEWVARPSSRGLLDPGIEPVSLMSLALGGRFCASSATLGLLH